MAESLGWLSGNTINSLVLWLMPETGYPVFMISVVPGSLATYHQPHLLSSFSQFRATSVNRGDDMGWEKTVQVAAF